MTTDEKILIRELITIDGFNRRFYAYLGTGLLQKEAFSRLNEEYRTLFGKARYANYESFRKAREYQLRKRKSKIKPGNTKKQSDK